MKFSIRPYTIAMTACLTLTTGHLVGCGEEEEPVVVKPAPVQRGPQYAVQDLPMNVKVQYPEKYTPMSEALGQAIADFASALATGDATAFGDMLASDERNFLRNFLVPSGQWEEDTQSIRAVRVVNLVDGESIAQVALAVGTDVEAYLTAWKAERVDGNTWTFSAIPVAPRTTTRVALLDDSAFEEDALSWLRSWGDVREQLDPFEEDFDFETPEDQDDGDDFSPPSSPGSPSSPSSPSSPGAPASPFG